MTPKEHEVFAEMVGAAKLARDALLGTDGLATDPDNRSGWSDQESYAAYMALDAALSRAQSLPDPGAATEHNRRAKEAAHYSGVRASIAWLHARADGMADPHAKAVLNGAAYALGLEKPPPDPGARGASRGSEADKACDCCGQRGPIAYREPDTGALICTNCAGSGSPSAPPSYDLSTLRRLMAEATPGGWVAFDGREIYPAAAIDSCGFVDTSRQIARSRIEDAALIVEMHRVCSELLAREPSAWSCRSCGAPFASSGGKIVGGTCPKGRPTCPLEPVT